MKAVEGFTKEDYKKECAADGGEAFEFRTFEDAAKHLANMAGYAVEDEKEGILNDTNCDWVIFGDGSVLFRYYGVNYDKEYIERMRETA